MARKTKGGLGKGLNALIADATIESGTSGSQDEISLAEIVPNPNQPRTNFNEDELADLADSIKKEGFVTTHPRAPLAGQVSDNSRRTQVASLQDCRCGTSASPCCRYG